MSSYAPEELMACVIARALADGDRVGVGVNSPIPAAGVLLARACHAPGLRYRLPGVEGSQPFSGSKEFFDFALSGRLDVFFLSGAQIDAWGRINLHVIGDYERPARRLPGAFGSAVLYPVVRRVILFRGEHSPRVLVPRLDFITAAGRPEFLVTPLAVLSPDLLSGRLELASCHPGHGAAEVRAATGFELEPREPVSETPPPTRLELEAFRGEVLPRLAAVYPRFVTRLAGA